MRKGMRMKVSAAPGVAACIIRRPNHSSSPRDARLGAKSNLSPSVGQSDRISPMRARSCPHIVSRNYVTGQALARIEVTDGSLTGSRIDASVIRMNGGHGLRIAAGSLHCPAHHRDVTRQVEVASRSPAERYEARVSRPPAPSQRASRCRRSPCSAKSAVQSTAIPRACNRARHCVTMHSTDGVRWLER